MKNETEMKPPTARIHAEISSEGVFSLEINNGPLPDLFFLLKAIERQLSTTLDAWMSRSVKEEKK